MINIFFETKLKHDICLIKYYSLELTEVDVASLNVIFDSASCADKQINSLL